MRKIFYFITLNIITLFALIVWQLYHAATFSVENLISIVGFISITSSAILLYFQLKVNLSYNQRKAAVDFSHDKIAKELFPLLKDLKSHIKKDLTILNKNENIKDLFDSQNFDDQTKKTIRILVIDILNFYERMSIGIFKNVYDEDICYDDNGFNMVHFYHWVDSFINELKNKYDDRIFINFQHLAERWETRLEKETRSIQKMKKKVNQKSTIANPHI